MSKKTSKEASYDVMSNNVVNVTFISFRKRLK